jgi:hypothetical protein
LSDCNAWVLPPLVCCVQNDFGAACWPRFVACGLYLRQSECGNAQCVCAVYSPGDDCTFREQRQTARSCATGRVLAAQQNTARLLGVVLIIGVNRRYSLMESRSGESFLTCLRRLLLSIDECSSDRPPFILVSSVLSVLPLEG